MAKLTEDAQQITSELATNALLHAQNDSPIVLLLMYAAGTLRIEVRDEAVTSQPAKRNPSGLNEDGWGLVIVEAVSQRWGMRVTDLSKAVWAELDVTGHQVANDSGLPEGGRQSHEL